MFCMDCNVKEVTAEFPGLISVYKDGSVDKLWGSPHVPCSLEDPDTGISSKDITISAETGLSARLFLPKLTNSSQKLPNLIYLHGGGFCVESAFSLHNHRYMDILASQAQVLVVSVKYWLAPEHPLPTAYVDCWDALNWVASHVHASDERNYDLWLVDHGDFKGLFIGGDSSGANIAHNIAMQAGIENLDRVLKILGTYLSHSYFLGPKQEPVSERDMHLDMAYKIWNFVYPDAPGGSDCSMLNPLGAGAPSLAGLGCSRVLVLVAGEDLVRDFGVRHYQAVRDSGYEGRVELFEVPGEGHGFHIFNPETQNAKLMFERLVSFLQK